MRFAIIVFICTISFGQILPVCANEGRHLNVSEKENNMSEDKGVRITVGLKDADIIGSDNRALQAAVDYVANLGGGLVEIGPGEFLMEDSLHLHSNVILRGKGKDTILKKSHGYKSKLVLDGDYGQEEITVEAPSGFKVGMGVTVCDDRSGGFHTTVATIIGAQDNTFRINKPLMADCMVSSNAIAKNTFPIVSAYHVENVQIENLTLEGNKENNEPLNGCRGACIFLYRAHRTQIKNCVAKNYNGDGISFQQSNDVRVENCECYGNTNLGLHPGSGSQRPVISNNRSYQNDEIGLFLCWRVKHGLFEDNEIRDNGRIGISIGHKDTDNAFRNNLIIGNGIYGIYFRDESEPMAGHRNLIENNTIQNNGNEEEGYGIYIDGETRDIKIVDNKIGDTNPDEKKVQRYGVFIGEKADGITILGNQLDGNSRAPVKNK